MPARHISNQSFDNILSDLGDDPAIPDPHGIRKPPPHQSPPPRPAKHSQSNLFTEPLDPVQIKNLATGLLGPIILIGILIAAAITFFITYNVLENQSQRTLEDSQKEISALKKDIALMRDEINQDQEDLYLVIDEIEVSIHSLMDKKPETRVISKPQLPTHESELRRWRYLGSSMMGAFHQAYFQAGKSHLAFEKGAQVLGDWRLANIEKELVTLTHSQGKSLILKVSKGE